MSVYTCREEGFFAVVAAVTATKDHKAVLAQLHDSEEVMDRKSKKLRDIYGGGELMFGIRDGDSCVLLTVCEDGEMLLDTMTAIFEKDIREFTI